MYVLDSGLDVVIENAGEGSDTVETASSFTSGGNIENVTLTGSNAANATGDSGNNVLTGNGAANALTGNAGNDTLVSGGGADTMTGGSGDDTYVVGSSLAGLALVENAGEGSDTIQIAATHTLGTDFENLTLTGSNAINGTGNAANNRIEGNDGANVLDGLAGADTLIGGAGNDTINGGVNDIMYGGLGDDTYFLTGTSVSIDVNIIEEGTGIDKIISDQSIDLGGYANVVRSVENATLVGTANATLFGHAGNNILIGNDGNNRITDYFGGTDSLDGGLGNDTIIGGVNSTMVGGVGNDTLIYDKSATTAVLKGGAGDDFYDLYYGVGTVTENIGEGIDTINMTTTGGQTTYTLAANVENLISGIATITGNGLDNIITGGTSVSGLAGHDTFQAANSAAQTLVGGAGNDMFKIDAIDTVTESANEGVDTVVIGATYTLLVNFENLTLNGTSAANGTGNSADNVIAGNSAANTLDGLVGSDILAGQDGNDTLTNASGAGAMDGGTGTDTLNGGSAAEFFAGGMGNDSIQLGSGADIIAFNRGDGADTVVTGALAGDLGDTLSIGKFDISSIRLNKEGSDLVVKIVGTSDAVRLKDWYVSASHHSVKTLQWMVDSNLGSYAPGSGDTLRDTKVKTFNFESIVGQFDAALVANPSLTNWAPPTTVYQSTLQSSSDTMAIGGALTSLYAKDGMLQNVDRDVALGLIGNAGFGTTAQSTSNGAGSPLFSNSVAGSDLAELASGSSDDESPFVVGAGPAVQAPSSPSSADDSTSSPTPEDHDSGVFVVGPLQPTSSAAAPDRALNEDAVLAASVRSSQAHVSDMWQDVDAWLQLQVALGVSSDSGVSHEGEFALVAGLQANGRDPTASGALAPTVHRIEQVASINEVAVLR